jgi:hypothetical protein
MVLEAIKFAQAEAFPVETNHGVKIVRRPGDTKCGQGFHGDVLFG